MSSLLSTSERLRSNSVLPNSTRNVHCNRRAGDLLRVWLLQGLVHVVVPL